MERPTRRPDQDPRREYPPRMLPELPVVTPDVQLQCVVCVDPFSFHSVSGRKLEERTTCVGR